jgi:hypothetical protein
VTQSNETLPLVRGHQDATPMARLCDHEDAATALAADFPGVDGRILRFSACGCRAHQIFGRANVLPLSRVRPFARGCATPRVALFEPRKRRANERPHVGSCGELAGVFFRRNECREPHYSAAFKAHDEHLVSYLGDLAGSDLIASRPEGMGDLGGAAYLEAGRTLLQTFKERRPPNVLHFLTWVETTSRDTWNVIKTCWCYAKVVKCVALLLAGREIREPVIHPFEGLKVLVLPDV